MRVGAVIRSYTVCQACAATLGVALVILGPTKVSPHTYFTWRSAEAQNDSQLPHKVDSLINPFEYLFPH